MPLSTKELLKKEVELLEEDVVAKLSKFDIQNEVATLTHKKPKIRPKSVRIEGVRFKEADIWRIEPKPSFIVEGISN